MIKIVIANDERAAVRLLELLIKRTDDMTCIGKAKNGEEAVRMVQALRPDVVLMDLMMPGINGVEATKQIKATVPTTKVVVNTARADYTNRALDAGASKVLSIPIEQDEIINAIREVVNQPLEDDRVTK